ncbi:hypothetical protein [uncultured Gammaproteobacteria bacterium]|nr:hypothetical protein [uncultured Gammaproteobacteria bacterium]
MSDKNVKKMTLDELRAELNEINDSDNHTRKIEICTQIIELIPEEEKDDKSKAFYNRGNIYMSLGEYQKAINDYDQAIAINPKDARSFYNRGLSYRKLEKEEKAIKDFKKAQDLDPSIIAKEQIELIEKELSEKIKKTQASNKEVQNFQEILAVLKEEHKKEEDQWFEWSKWAVGATLGVISIAIGFSKSSDTYIIYVFSSIVTFAVIRQYTNAKALRIEASNRVAMSKMFEQVKHENDDAYRQEFLPKLADAIAYSTIKEKNSTDGLVEKIINGLEKLRK